MSLGKCCGDGIPISVPCKEPISDAWNQIEDQVRSSCPPRQDHPSILGETGAVEHGQVSLVNGVDVTATGGSEMQEGHAWPTVGSQGSTNDRSGNHVDSSFQVFCFVFFVWFQKEFIEFLWDQVDRLCCPPPQQKLQEWLHKTTSHRNNENQEGQAKPRVASSQEKDGQETKEKKGSVAKCKCEHLQGKHLAIQVDQCRQ